MKFTDVSLEPKAGSGSRTPVVRHSMLLHEVVTQFDLEQYPHLLIEDDCGKLIGIVESEDVVKHISLWNSVERKRWQDMPIDAAMQGRLSYGAPVDENAAARRALPAECTGVSDANGLVAILTDHGVFVHWDTVRASMREASVDPVTNLPNRGVFDRRLREEFFRTQRLGLSLAVVLIDVDHFKQINDHHGHAVGDMTLNSVGIHLRQQLRSYDFVARFGGDEFALICSGCRAGEIDIPIGRIRDSVADMIEWLGPPHPQITLSIGAVVIQNSTTLESPETLVELADQSLYCAKRNGRNTSFKCELANAAHVPEPVEIHRPALVATPV